MQKEMTLYITPAEARELFTEWFIQSFKKDTEIPWFSLTDITQYENNKIELDFFFSGTGLTKFTSALAKEHNCSKIIICIPQNKYGGLVYQHKLLYDAKSNEP